MSYQVLWAHAKVNFWGRRVGKPVASMAEMGTSPRGKEKMQSREGEEGKRNQNQGEEAAVHPGAVPGCVPSSQAPRSLLGPFPPLLSRPLPCPGCPLLSCPRPKPDSWEQGHFHSHQDLGNLTDLNLDPQGWLCDDGIKIISQRTGKVLLGVLKWTSLNGSHRSLPASPPNILLPDSALLHTHLTFYLFSFLPAYYLTGKPSLKEF